MKRYLVTGGAGFIGSSIVKNLILNGYSVKVLDNLSRGNLTKLAEVKGQFEFISADIRDSKRVINASKDCDGIIHLAYVNGTKFFYSKPNLVLDIGIRGMISVIDAGRTNKISELYLASSSEVYQTPTIIPTPEDIQLVIPDPYNPRFSYGGGKILSELMAIHMGAKLFKKIVIFRPHNVYGPDMGEEHAIPEFIRRMIFLKKNNGKKFEIQGTGNETRSYIFIEDFSDALLTLIKKGRNLNTYNIGTQDEISSKNLAKKIASIVNIDINIAAGKLQKGSTLKRCPDTTKIKALGFMPKTNLTDGLKKTYLWYNNELK